MLGTALVPWALDIIFLNSKPAFCIERLPFPMSTEKLIFDFWKQ
jgi:hypothetical protein